MNSLISFGLRNWTHLLRLLLLGLTLTLLVQDHNHMAFAVLGALLLLNFRLFAQAREFAEEHPYRILGIRSLDMGLSVALLGTILYREVLLQGGAWPVMLVAGWGLLLVRLILYPIYAVSLIRADKDVGYSSVWSKLARTGITVTTMAYVFDIQHYREIMMGAMMLLIFGSGTAYLYRYYRDPDHRKPLSIASQITVSRIVLTPVFIWVFFHDSDLDYTNNLLIFKVLAFVMVCLFMFTDWLDGYLARKMNEVSTLGKYLDPFSDKISNFTIFLCFMASGYANIWMVALIYFREASVETLRTLAASQGLTIAARPSGKWKTAIQGVGILLVLAGAIAQNYIPGAGFWESFAWWVMASITGVTLLSGADYFWSSREVLKKYL